MVYSKKEKELILKCLEENPTFTKGDLVREFNLPITNSKGEESLSLSKLIWVYNHNTQRKGYYSLTPSVG